MHAPVCRLLPRVLGVVALLLATGAQAGTLRVAVTASMKSAFTALAADFGKANPGDTVTVTYGSSGKLVAQVANGAPFDLFFSADMTYPQALVAQGHAAGPVHPYAVGHLVLWSLQPGLAQLPLEKLADAPIRRFAIANPGVAPYGERAREALQRAGAWGALEPKLVLGENITQAAQFIDTGAADAGLIALSLVLGPELQGRGHWSRVPDDVHEPLLQGYVVLRRAQANPLAARLAAYLAGAPAQRILARYGFDAP